MTTRLCRVTSGKENPYPWLRRPSSPSSTISPVRKLKTLRQSSSPSKASHTRSTWRTTTPPSSATTCPLTSLLLARPAHGAQELAVPTDPPGAGAMAVLRAADTTGTRCVLSVSGLSRTATASVTAAGCRSTCSTRGKRITRPQRTVTCPPFPDKTAGIQTAALWHVRTDAAPLQIGGSRHRRELWGAKRAWSREAPGRRG